ncbi:heme biosynthesis protein HemY [Pseudooceanicola nanhaiensis]|jgi:HemY protein|uniref:Heme biosynthesis protein HemY n=1 Tax=Pseudooceanicola nanhaiensis TaxID=375761 RepID=A0A917T3N8_9RHOB|nr:heme biosynthesis HemY N-terminal domain-containing protein [Pseudooceanicola nanhaiensis]GGM08267.1 heme biosynthesis protein HemY [Pseudooceanicola nanhaiensis]
MLWSLVKIVLFVLIVAAATMFASYLLELDGSVRIAIGSVEYNLNTLTAVISLLVLILAVWVLIKLLGLLVAVLRFINGDETAMSRYFDRNRERKGYQAVRDGMIALASGESRLAMAKAQKAQKYLDSPELTTLLIAQAAEQAGDRKKAEDAYKALLADDRTRFVGVRGIMKQKLSDGDTETAMKLAEKAFALKPAHREVQDTLLQLQAQKEDWKGARATLNAKLRHGALPRDVHKRRDAVLALSEAKGVFDEGNTIEAREAAIEANRLSPDLIPAAVMAARSYIAQDKPKYATRVLKKAWEVHPHPDLAAAFAEIEPDEDPKARLKRYKALTKSHPEHRETRLLLAELYLADEDFPEARRALGDLAVESPDARTLSIMAAVERGEGKPDAVVRGWLTRAVSASRGPQWTCEKCGHIHGEWVPVCTNCGAFDTLAWREAPASEFSTLMSSATLPLIVGKLDEPRAEPSGQPPAPQAAPHPAPAPEPAMPEAAADVPDAEILPPDEAAARSEGSARKG